MQNKYLPEGRKIDTDENRMYTSSVAHLTEAFQKEMILEAVAVKCDSFKNLHVDFGFCTGIIPREEALYNPSGEAVKDIAIITRVGKPVCFKVTGIDRTAQEPCRVTLSRRLAQKECYENKAALFDEGDIITATVTHMEQFGAFCDIGCGLIALLPIDCISVSRISHPCDRFVTGQHINAVIKTVDRELCRITLSHKELLGTWEQNAALFKAGETVSGIVRSVEPYGVFIELTANLAGLAEWTDGVAAGQQVTVYIKNIIPEKNKVKLVIVDVRDKVTSPAPMKYFHTAQDGEKLVL